MEINYTNFELDERIYGVNEVCGLIDKTGKFIYNNFYDVRKLTYNENLPVNLFLRFGTKKENKKIIFDMLSELEISKELQKRPLKTLSESELLKVLIIKVCLSHAKTVILDSIDIYLNPRDLSTVLKTIKNHLVEIQKRVIFRTNKIDNILMNTDRYIITESDKIIYNGKNLTDLPIDSELKEFVNLAKKKGAKLDYYKDLNDLLKAIYRDVKS